MSTGEPPPRHPPQEVEEKRNLNHFQPKHHQTVTLNLNQSLCRPISDAGITSPQVTYAAILKGNNPSVISQASSAIKAQTFKPFSVDCATPLNGNVSTHSNLVFGDFDPKINFLLKPTMEYCGKKAILFQKADKLRLLKRIPHVLIGKFSHGRPPMSVIKHFFCSLKLKGSYNISLFDSKHMYIECVLFEDFIRIWLENFWLVRGFQMRVFKWGADFNPKYESPVAPVWVHLYGLPLYLFDKEALMSIANAIGSPLFISRNTLNRSNLSFASLCVELDVTRPLLDEVWIDFGKEVRGPDESIEQRDGFWQRLCYGALPSYCSFCAHIGHSLESCKLKKAKTSGASLVNCSVVTVEKDSSSDQPAVENGFSGGTAVGVCAGATMTVGVSTAENAGSEISVGVGAAAMKSRVQGVSGIAAPQIAGGGQDLLAASVEQENNASGLADAVTAHISSATKTSAVVSTPAGSAVSKDAARVSAVSKDASEELVQEGKAGTSIAGHLQKTDLVQASLSQPVFAARNPATAGQNSAGMESGAASVTGAAVTDANDGVVSDVVNGNQEDVTVVGDSGDGLETDAEVCATAVLEPGANFTAESGETVGDSSTETATDFDEVDKAAASAQESAENEAQTGHEKAVPRLGAPQLAAAELIVGELCSWEPDDTCTKGVKQLNGMLVKCLAQTPQPVLQQRQQKHEQLDVRKEIQDHSTILSDVDSAAEMRGQIRCWRNGVVGLECLESKGDVDSVRSNSKTAGDLEEHKLELDMQEETRMQTIQNNVTTNNQARTDSCDVLVEKEEQAAVEFKPLKLSSAAPEFKPKWAVLVEELVQETSHKQPKPTAGKIVADRVQRVIAKAQAALVEKKKKQSHTVLVDENAMEQLKERLNRLRGDDLPAASTGVLSEEMKDIICPFKCKSVPNSPPRSQKKSKSLFVSPVYSQATQAHLKKYGSETSDDASDDFDCSWQIYDF